MLNNANVKLVGTDIVRKRAALTQLGFQVGRCEFLNIAHNLTFERQAFNHASMFETLAERLDVMCDKAVLPDILINFRWRP